MADLKSENKQNEGEENVENKSVSSTLISEVMQSSTNEKHSIFIGSLSNKSEDQEIEHKIACNHIDEASKTNVQPATSGYQQNSCTLLENLAKRSKDQADSDNDKLQKSDCNSEYNKRQKLNESQAATLSSNNSQESNNESSFTFSKLKSKFKKRNYRSQSDSSDIADDSSEHITNEAAENVENESSSSEFIEFEEDESESFLNNSELVSEENDDSSIWSAASDDLDSRVKEVMAGLKKKPSKSDWCIVKDVISRQIGFNNSIQCRFYSSSHMVQRLKLMYKLEEHYGCVNSLGFNQKGNLLASASDDLRVIIWDWAIGKEKQVILNSSHRSNIFQSKWLPLDMERYVVTCARDGQVRLIDIQSSDSSKLAQHRSACHKISTHLDLPHIVLSAGEDSKVLLIDIREQKAQKLLSVKENEKEISLYSIHSNPFNDFEFCVAGRMRFVKIYDRRKPTTPVKQFCPVHLLSNKFAQVTSAVYNYNGTEIVASYSNEHIYLFDTMIDAMPHEKRSLAHTYTGHRNSATVKGVNFFGPQSEFILSGSDCGNIFIWDKKTEAIVQWMPGDEKGIVNVLEPHPHIPILATSGLDSDVKIWSPSQEERPIVQEKLKHCVHQNSVGFMLDEISPRLTHLENNMRLFARIGNRLLNNDSEDESDLDIDDNDEDDEDNDFFDDENNIFMNNVNDSNSSMSSTSINGSDYHSES